MVQGTWLATHMTWAQEGREQKQKELAKSEVYAEAGVGKPSKGRKKRFGMEYRYTEEVVTYWGERRCWLSEKDYREWRPFYTWYETAKQRDQAMEVLSKKMFLDKALYHEYRAIKR